jgi:hypothetical protein
MKKSMVLMMVTAVCVNGADVVVPVPKWDGTGQEDPQIEEVAPPKEGVPMLKFAMEAYVLDRHPDGHENEWLRMYAKTNGIPDSVLYGLAKELVEKAEAVLKTKDPDRGYMSVQAGRMLNLMRESNDPTLLLYLEEKIGSDIDTVRERSAVAYVTIAGIDSTALMRKLFLDNRDESWWRYEVIAAFLQQLESAKSKASKKKMDVAYAVLIEQVQDTNKATEADQIDQFLCQQLPEYSTSRQCHRMAKRFYNTGNDWVRNTFNPITEIIDKLPEAKRVDLCQRFKQLS